jgi:hypothetical protein
LTRWETSLLAAHGNPFAMALVAIVLFPKLALGLSGFETGVAVMPLCGGTPTTAQGTPWAGFGTRVASSRRRHSS